MGVFIQIVQFLLSLSILVALHEMGHFLAAKFFKTKVEKFYLFFNPWLRFRSPEEVEAYRKGEIERIEKEKAEQANEAKPKKVKEFEPSYWDKIEWTSKAIYKKQIGETEYGIGWLPLGGYVKIAGMIDESMDLEQMKQPAQPWEFRSKPAWQRLIIMIGGITVNFLLAIFIFSMMTFGYGEYKLSNSKLTMGYAADSLQQQYGFRSGDLILGYDEVIYDEKPKGVIFDLLLNDAKIVHILRDGKKIDIPVKEEFLRSAVDSEFRYGQFVENFPPIVDSVFPELPLSKTAVKKGDRIIGVDGQQIVYFDELTQALKGKNNDSILLTYVHIKDTFTVPLQLDSNGKMGFYPNPDLGKYYSFDTIHHGFFASFGVGLKQTAKIAKSYLKQFKIMIKYKLYKQVGGLIKMGSVFPSNWDWYKFWSLTALLSVILAVMNLLPIPALDGGHVMFTLYEIVFRRKPNEKFMEYAQTAGVIFLLSLMLIINGKDIIELIIKLFHK